MKKLLLLLVLMLVGCTASETKVTEENRLELKGEVCGYKIREFEYDGCQYIAFGSGEDLAITHKGNCKYCRERAKR